MDNEPKKISFGFNKLLKKSNIIVKQPIEEKKCEIIEYIEEKSIKVVGGNDTPKGPLVIPMKESNKTKLSNLIDIVQNNFQETEAPQSTNIENSNGEGSKKAENLSLEEQAAQELLNDTKNVKIKEDNKRIINVSNNEEKVTFDGEKESTLEDYEEIPIEEFGKAMLRGMGWKDGQGIGKNQQLIKMAQPHQRPKGMGLGADKMAKQDKNDKPAVDRDGNTLKCVKGAFVKIIAGYHKGNYGQILGLDDESGRFIIKTAINNLNLSLNEFLVSPVTKDEYTKNSKVINNAKYEEYLQKKEDEEKRKLQQIKKDRKSSEEDRKDSRRESRKSYSSDEEHRSRKSKYDETQKSTKKEKRYSDSEEDNRYRDKYAENIKKERTDKHEKRIVKTEKNVHRESQSRKSEKSSKYDSEEETVNRKHKSKNKNKSKYSSESEDDRKSRIYEKSSKYISDEESRDRKYRERHKMSSKYASDSEEEASTSKKKSSKYDSDSEDYEQSRKKHKKKKSKKYSSEEESDDRYKKSSKKKEKKYDSDSEEEREKKKKKDKHKDKRNRSRHERR